MGEAAPKTPSNEHNLRYRFTLNETKRFLTYLFPFFLHNSPGKLANFLRLEWAYLRRTSTLGARPYLLKIDPTNACNIQCTDCYTGQLVNQRPRGFMTFETFQKIVDQNRDACFKILLYGWGESFLVKDIFRMIRYASDNNISVAISSNMSLTDKQFDSDAVVASGLEVLTISLDGLTQQTYEKVRPGGRVDLIFNNMRALVAAKRKRRSFFPILEWQFLVYEGNRHEIPRAKALAREIGVNFIRFSPHMDLDQTYAPRPKVHERSLEDLSSQPYVRSGCAWSYRAAVFNWNGDVSPCCSFVATDNVALRYGNVHQQPFAEIWNGPAYRQTRDFVQTGRWGEPRTRIPCLDCHLSFKEGVHDDEFIALEK